MLDNYLEGFLTLLNRTAFVFLAISVYRIWHMFSTPTIRARARRFIKFSSAALLVSLLLNFLGYWVTHPIAQLSSVTFNLLITISFAFYFNLKADQLSKVVDTSDYQNYSKAMDDLIKSLKK